MANDLSKKRIFVQIASYRDTDCQWTVKDMFEKAAHPERIFVGICWQFIKEEDAVCFEVPYPRPDQVRVHEVDARQGKGVCWARSLTQKLWEGEEFTLQLDSHMRFEQDWDDLLLDMWQECEHEKAILTCYPGGFEPPDKLERGWVFGMCAERFNEHGILLMRGKPGFSTSNPLPDKPIPGAFASACVLFGPSCMINDIPYDPNLYFFGEEISLAVRLWTHGYELFHPNKLAIYHDWKRGKRKTHFADHKDWTIQNSKSYARVRHLLGVSKSEDPEIIKDLDVYGLGNVRTLEEYQEYSGVNFAKQRIADFAHQGIYSTKTASGYSFNSRAKKDNRIFVQIASYRDRECQHTIHDLFEKAKNPDRIFVGVCWQFNPQEDEDCFQVSTRPDQVRMLPYDWYASQGVCFARNQAQQLWEGEEYTLQIDSHSRFVQNWDELMIAELAACESSKPVLSCAPAAYTPPNNLQRDALPTIRRALPFNEDGNIRYKSEYIERSPERPLNAAFISSDFVFARSQIFEEVPHDPYLYFDQEESVYSARLYTYGWDIFSSRTPLLYHFYNLDSKSSARQRHMHDLHVRDPKHVEFLKSRGINRFNHMVGFQWSNDTKTTRDLMKFGFGRVRTLEQYEAYSGVDFRHKTVSERALQCQFINGLEKYRTMPIVIPESERAKQKTSFIAPVHVEEKKPIIHEVKMPSNPMPTVSSNVSTLGGHQPKKVFESKQAIIFDDFLPPDVYEKIQQFAIKTDYEYINTKGKVTRAWHVHDGFPMRSMLNEFYYARGSEKPAGDHVYPTKTDMDLFIDNLIAVQPYVEHLTGKEGTGGWLNVSSTCWVYPHGTALSIHDDGSGVYTGAYVYFLNPTWRPHWGGLLIMMDEEANRIVFEHRSKIDQMDYYKKKFFHANGLDEMMVDQGFGKCIFPKGNRIVFIANDAYHMVTRVNEAAGDNLRMSIAGFFNRKK